MRLRIGNPAVVFGTSTPPREQRRAEARSRSGASGAKGIAENKTDRMLGVLASWREKTGDAPQQYVVESGDHSTRGAPVPPSCRAVVSPSQWNPAAQTHPPRLRRTTLEADSTPPAFSPEKNSPPKRSGEAKPLPKAPSLSAVIAAGYGLGSTHGPALRLPWHKGCRFHLRPGPKAGQNLGDHKGRGSANP